MPWSLIIIPVCVLFGFALILYLFQSNFIYFPSRDIIITPEAAGLSFESVKFKTEDDITLSGWYIPSPNPRGFLLFCHGNAGNISHRIESIMVFNRLNLNVFIFDYRGYGQSDGKPTEKGTYLDVLAAWNWLLNHKNAKAKQIIVFGRSLGGAIASWLARTESPGALILESVFTSISDIGADVYPFLPVKLLARFNYNSLENINNINCPLLIIHSSDDDIIPFHHGQRLYENAGEPKTFLKISGSHNNGFHVSGSIYSNGIDSFVSNLLKD